MERLFGVVPGVIGGQAFGVVLGDALKLPKEKGHPRRNPLIFRRTLPLWLAAENLRVVLLDHARTGLVAAPPALWIQRRTLRLN
jgi:hypothetical protein